MKKIYTLLLSTCCLWGLNAQTPIVFDDSHMPVPGDSAVYHTDTLSMGLSPGSAGESQDWNFSDLGDHTVNTIYYLDPADTPNATDFPTATEVIDFGGGGFLIYTETNADGNSVLGFSADFTGTGELAALPFPNAQQTYQFPTAYGEAFTDDYTFQFSFDGSDFGVDSVRFVRQGTYSVEVDGWGLVTTPMGTFGSLRRHIVDSYTETTSIYTFGTWVPFDESDSVEESYEWLAREAKGPVLTMNIDNATGQVTTVDYAEATPIPPPVANFSYDPNNLELTFTDLSTGEPNGWLWDFSDGNTSTDQNPVHTYASSDTYEVCLTASNGSGSHTYCANVAAFAASTHDPANSLDMGLAPNPAGDFILLSIGEAGLFDLSITDLLGRELKRVQGLSQGQHHIPLDGLSKGVYLFRVHSTNSDKMGMGKVMVK